MKTTLPTLALAAASLVAAAQAKTTALASASVAAPAASTAPSAYLIVMTATVAAQSAAATPADVQANLAQLERVAAAAPSAWEPRYYQARGYLKLGFAGKDGDQQDQLFDQAQTALDQAKKLPGADQAEVLILQAYIYQGRIMVSPMTRGMVYAGRVADALGQAKALAPGNPRVYLLLGNDLFYRPAMFGGGAEKAQPLYAKAKALFATFRPATALSPAWGEKMNDAMLAKTSAEATK
ncbi:hypothetical protein GCM10011495_17710 [Hymenobacter frigidus]|uniref:Tetratricopeptide repeat protein n=1 Tax=Hymenobacter frigidus TaxID=1524095 RepID=A0ABQ2A5Z2_9BACT|nr:hypothetical protein [Hymenobacter frigidus]GGH84845.1 hypothetical protein GCM10011495_17710 [Hymenobacter frigidus]